MAIGVALFITALAIVAVWIIIEIKRMRHKIFAIILIVLILFFYITFTYNIKGKNIDLKTVSGVVTASKVYFTWLGGFFGNLKTITTNAIKMDWGISNSSIG